MLLIKNTERFQMKLPEVEDWGEISYTEAFEKQKQYVEEVISGERPETLVFCSHPPVVTLGRGTKDGDLFSWQGETVEVNRGGRCLSRITSPDEARERGVPPGLVDKAWKLAPDAAVLEKVRKSMGMSYGCIPL